MDEELDLETPKTPEGENPEESEMEPEKSIEEKPEQSKELQSALAQKEHFRKKYEESQEELKKPRNSTFNGQNPMEVVKLTKALEGYSEEEVEFITRNASEKSIEGIVDASKDDWVKTAILARREKVVNEKKTLEPSTKQSLSEKSVEDTTNQDLRNMSVKNKEKFLEKIGWGPQPRPKR